MAVLLDCADEIILLIISSLHALYERDEPPIHRRFCAEWEKQSVEWPAVSRNKEATRAHVNKDVRSLILSSRRLAHLLQPILYNHIVLPKPQKGLPSRVAPLIFSLAADPTLGHCIHTVSITGLKFSLFLPILRLPNIHTLTISNWNQIHFPILPHQYQTVTFSPPPSDDPYEFRPFSSPVKDIRLKNCGSDEHYLYCLFRLPSALESVSYECNGYSWELEHISAPDPTTWAPTMFLRALYPDQRGSIRRLNFSQKYAGQMSLLLDTSVRLSDFTMVKELCICDRFLAGPEEIWQPYVAQYLPRGLEILVVNYSDSWLSGWLDSQQRIGHWTWLEHVPQWKEEFLHQLKAVRVKSTERRQYEEAETWFSMDCKLPWTPPAEIREEFEKSGVELSVVLHYE